MTLEASTRCQAGHCIVLRQHTLIACLWPERDPIVLSVLEVELFVENAASSGGCTKDNSVCIKTVSALEPKSQDSYRRQKQGQFKSSPKHRSETTSSSFEHFEK